MFILVSTRCSCRRRKLFYKHLFWILSLLAGILPQASRTSSSISPGWETWSQHHPFVPKAETHSTLSPPSTLKFSCAWAFLVSLNQKLKPFLLNISTELSCDRAWGLFTPHLCHQRGPVQSPAEISELHLTPTGTKIWSWELISFQSSLLEVWATSIFGEASRDGLCSVHLILPLTQHSRCKSPEELHSQFLLEASWPSWLQ